MNPFKYGQVVNGNDFCPRPKLIKIIKSFIKSGQNIYVQGERRIGKTSLIMEAIHSCRGKRVYYVDLLEIKTTASLCQRLAKALISFEQQNGVIEKILKSLSQLKPTIGFDTLTGTPTISIDPAIKFTPDSLNGLLDMLFDIHKKRNIVVVIDEFQDILNLRDSKEALAIFRSKIQFHSSLPYIFSGSIRNKMFDIFNNPESAFFKSAIPVHVCELDHQYFTKFLKDKFALGKRKITEKTITKIFNITDNISGDVQQLCMALWDTTSYNEKITEYNIPSALKLIFARESKGYEHILVQITDQQLKCLVGLAKKGGKSPQSAEFLSIAGISLPASVKKALNRLEQLKIVYRYENEYKFINSFFKSWLIFKNL